MPKHHSNKTLFAINTVVELVLCYFINPTLHGEEKYEVPTLDELSSSKIISCQGHKNGSSTHKYRLTTDVDLIYLRFVPVKLATC